MNVPAPRIRASSKSQGGFLYGWLLLCLFIEYARPAYFFPFLNIPSLYSILPLLLFVVSLFAPGLRSPKEAFSDPQAKWYFWLLGVVFLSLLIFRAYAIDVFTTVLGYVLLFTVITRLCDTWARIRGVVIMLVVAHLFLLAMNPNVLLDPSTRQYIKGATFLGDGNDFGLSLCLLFPLVIWLFQTSRSAFGKVLIVLSILIMLYAVMATQSRGATLGIGAVMFFLWLQSKKKLLGGILIALVGVAVLALAPGAYFNRMSSLANPTDGSAQGRVDAWKAGIGMGAKNPLIGVGAGHFGPRWGKTAHSTYVLAFGELGLPGFIFIIAIVVGNVRATMALRRRVLAHGPQAPPEEQAREKRGARKQAKEPEAESREQELGRYLLMIAAAMVGFGVAGAFLSATYYPHVYVLGGVMLAARYIAAREAGIPLLDPEKSRQGFRRQVKPAPAASGAADAGEVRRVRAE